MKIDDLCQMERSNIIITRFEKVMNATIETFRSIVEDPQLSDQEIGKYLSWGKGNL